MGRPAGPRAPVGMDYPRLSFVSGVRSDWKTVFLSRRYRENFHCPYPASGSTLNVFPWNDRTSSPTHNPSSPLGPGGDTRCRDTGGGWSGTRVEELPEGLERWTPVRVDEPLHTSVEVVVVDVVGAVLGQDVSLPRP